MPALQDLPPLHDVPQAPQLVESVSRSAQTPLHRSSPTMHEPWHLPLLHSSLLAQAVPQLPQSAVLVARLTQVPEQLVVPTGQPQAPEVQVAPPLHATPQPPQLALSV